MQITLRVPFSIRTKVEKEVANTAVITAGRKITKAHEEELLRLYRTYDVAALFTHVNNTVPRVDNRATKASVTRMYVNLGLPLFNRGMRYYTENDRELTVLLPLVPDDTLALQLTDAMRRGLEAARQARELKMPRADYVDREQHRVLVAKRRKAMTMTAVAYECLMMGAAQDEGVNVEQQNRSIENSPEWYDNYPK